MPPPWSPPASIYIARLHVLFSLAPPVQFAVAIIGTLTLLLASFSALTQSDVKRVLAYSTMSQIGYMFLALGVGAWSAAIFHFFTHAFFKSLLFLAAGLVDHRPAGGTRHGEDGRAAAKMPLVFWTFLIGALSLSAFPLITAGFYSKDEILLRAWASTCGQRWLWAGGCVAAVLTGLYSFRMVFLIFFGKEKQAPEKVGGLTLYHPAGDAGDRCRWLPGWCGFPCITLRRCPSRGFYSRFSHRSPRTRRAGGKTALATRRRIRLAGRHRAGLFLFPARAGADGTLGTVARGAALAHFWSIGWGFDWLYHISSSNHIAGLPKSIDVTPSIASIPVSPGLP